MFDTYKDIPGDVLDSMIELYTERAKAPSIAEAITETQLMKFNFSCGRHSILTELLQERDLRQRKAGKNG